VNVVELGLLCFWKSESRAGEANLPYLLVQLRAIEIPVYTVQKHRVYRAEHVMEAE